MPDYLALHACARGNKSPSHLHQIELGPAPSRNPNPHPEWHLTLALIPTQVEAELAIFDNLTMEQQNTEDAPKEDPEDPCMLVCTNLATDVLTCA